MWCRQSGEMQLLEWGEQTRSLSVQKNEKISRTILILEGLGAGGNCFFDAGKKTDADHLCNNKNIIYQQFYSCLCYIFYT